MHRRDFFATLPALQVLPAMAAEPEPGVLADPARELAATGADLGTLFADVDKLAAANPFALRFPSEQFKTYADYRTAARARVCELLSYKPPKVDPKPEVLDRKDCGEYVRERVVFSTTP